MPRPDITVGPGGTVYTGPDAVRMVQAMTISRALRLYAETRMLPSRAYTPTNMLAAASKITGKTYKRGEHLRAAQDLQQWADTMRASLDIQRKE